jgi:putative acetyltransferase
MSIHKAHERNFETVLALYPLAFPDEDLTGLVAELLPHNDVLNLVIERNQTIIAHAAFSFASHPDQKVALLGPLCVHPDHQRAGHGTLLVEHACNLLHSDRFDAILVLGNPATYQKMAFTNPSPILAPYPLKPEWAEAWRIRRLSERPLAEDPLVLPAPWMNEAYWR